MKTLGSALDSWKPAAGPLPDPAAALRAVWPDVVGDAAAANSRPVKIVRETLEIAARSNQWSEQLGYLAPRILQALHDRGAQSIERIRFRVGRVHVEGPAAPRNAPTRARRSRSELHGAAESLEAAVARFKASVAAAERAKARAGWRACGACGARVLPSAAICAPCENLRRQERDARVARLLFEAPWLGYAGIAALVENLAEHEYRTIRLQLLRRWKDALERVRRNSVRVTTHDRMIASSYVLLKSELDPERIEPAVVRDLLGDDLHQIFYGSNA